MKRKNMMEQLAEDLFQKKQDDLKKQGKDYLPEQDMTAEEIEKEQEEKPKPILKLLGEDGNAFFILGKARRVAKKNGLDWEKIKAEATSGDYDNLLATMMKYFEVE
jgi:hypothetical protein